MNISTKKKKKDWNFNIEWYIFKMWLYYLHNRIRLFSLVTLLFFWSLRKVRKANYKSCTSSGYWRVHFNIFFIRGATIQAEFVSPTKEGYAMTKTCDEHFETQIHLETFYLCFIGKWEWKLLILLWGII